MSHWNRIGKVGMRDPGARGVGIRVAFGSARLRARGKVLIKEGYREVQSH